MLSLKATLEAIKTKLNAHDKALSVDYIVEQGTSGIWTYRKWNSGIAECWALLEHTAATTGYAEAKFNLPITFKNRDYAQLTATGQGGWCKVRAPYDNASTSNNFVTLCYMNSTSSSTLTMVECYVKGVWK